MTDRIKHNPPDMMATDGPLDELVITGCDIHLEQMSERSFVLVITRGGEEMRVSIYAPGRGKVHARVDVVDAGFRAIAKGEG